MEWTYDLLRAECVRLRIAADEADVALLAFLWRIEHTPDMLALIVDAGQDLTGFIRNEVLVDLGLYQRFATGYVSLGCDEVEASAIGAEAVAGARCVDPDRMTAYLDAAHAWVEDHHGMRPKRDAAQRLASCVDPRARVPQSVQRRAQYAAQGEELQRLRAENRALKAQVAVLQKENAALWAERERLAAPTRPAGAESGGSCKPPRKARKVQGVSASPVNG